VKNEATNKETEMKSERHIEDGINGRGDKVWFVVTEIGNGRQHCTAAFDTLAEAENWIKWA